MTIKVGINGFGRIGRLAFRALFKHPNLIPHHINDPGATKETLAHLVQFDSVHGIWDKSIEATDSGFQVEGHPITVSHEYDILKTPWEDCDVVLECTGVIKTQEKLTPYLEKGVSNVIVSCPVSDDGIPNIVIGVNDHLAESDKYPILSNASCTTNCLAPIVKVIHENFGITHGSMTTIHSPTNNQAVLDVADNDLRRARACNLSLIPSSTGSAKAIGRIFPELDGLLNGHAVRVPTLNASLTDCIFEVKKHTTADEVNQLLQEAADGPLKGILGFEMRPLVSIDFKSDPRSSIVDGLSTLVVNNTHVKIYSWYDNEWGYSNRLVELAIKAAQ